MASGIDLLRVRSGDSPKDLTPLEKACRLGHNSQAISELIVQQGSTPPTSRALFFAAGSGDCLVLNLILAAGAPISSEPRFNPLNAACCASGAMADKVVDLLLKERPDCKPDQQTLVLACGSKIQAVAEKILRLRPPYTLETISDSLKEAAFAGFSLNFLERICAYVHTKPGGKAPDDPITREVEAQIKRKIIDMHLLEGLIKNGWKPQPSTVSCLLSCLRSFPLDRGRMNPLTLLIEKGKARVIKADAELFLRQMRFSLGDSEEVREVNRVALQELLSKKNFIC